jgi:hypothetical protein
MLTQTFVCNREKGPAPTQVRNRTADAELVRMIERRSRKGETDPDEVEPFYMENVRRYNDRRREEMRAGWCAYHQGQAARHRAVLELLIARHEAEAAKLMDVQPEGTEELGSAEAPRTEVARATGEGEVGS